MTVQEDIDELNVILDIAAETTPTFIKGLLIPDELIYTFRLCIKSISKKAIDSEEYWEMIQESTRNSEKQTMGWIKAFIDGRIQFTKKIIDYDK